MRTIAKRATALFMALITMLSLFSTVAFADWTSSFGGTGNTGTVGGGYWNENMQGIRVVSSMAECGDGGRVARHGWSLSG